MPIALAPSDQSLLVFPAQGDDAVTSWPRGAASSQSMMRAQRGPGATNMELAGRDFSPDAGNSNGGAGNLLTGAPAGPFVSARTHELSLSSTASSRSAYHPIAIG